MQALRRNCLYASFAWLVLLPLAPRTYADALTITSKPSGATVEFDGTVVGTTPYRVEYPGGYFHKTHTVFGERLRHSIVLHISKDGYASQHITITTGPFDWVSVNGRRHGTYFLLRKDRFDIQLEATSLTASEPADANGRIGPIVPRTVAAQLVPKGPSSQLGSVAVTSEPAGAEIYIDGKFAGQTPSTMPLASGSHQVVVKSQGRKNWERQLEVVQGSHVTLHPVLELQP